VISIYSNFLLQDALKIIATNEGLKLGTLFQLSGAIPNVTNINEMRLTFGARGYKEKRYNDFVHGWIGIDLLNATEKNTICTNYLSFHQAYPSVMVDLWSHVTAKSSPEVFTPPVLSRDINNLDNTKGYL